MALGDNIKKYRKEKGLCQEQLAEAMGVSTAAVSKWETGMAAPELTALADLADYFEVSIDALMGHVVSDDRKKALLTEQGEHCDEGRYEDAKAVAEKLLRSYPNDADVVSSAATCFYCAYTCTGDRPAMERCVELTKRLFALEEDPTGMKRFERMAQLGNQYAMLHDWEMSRKYYTESNVGGMNDRALAGLLTQEGRSSEAARAISDVLAENLFHMMTDLLNLSGSYEELGEPEKAEAALLWGVNVLETLSGDAVEHLMPLKTTMYLTLALSAEKREETERADRYIRRAMGCGEEAETETHDFLTCNKNGKLIGTMPTSPEAVLQLLSAMDEERLAAAARQILGE